MKKIYFLLLSMMLAFSANAARWFISGAFQGWSHCNANYELKETEAGSGIFKLTIDNPAFGGEFLICQGTPGNPDWNNKVGNTAGKAVKADEAYNYTPGGGNFKMDGTVANPTITLNTKNKTLLIEGPAKANEYDIVYLIGDFGSGWSETNTNYPLEKVSEEGDVQTFKGTYTLTAAKSYFKMKAGANVYGTGSGDIAVQVDKTYTASMEGNAFSLAGGDYTFTYVLPYNGETGQLTVSGKEVYPTTMYIIGNVNGTEWDPAQGAEMVPFGEGVFVAESVYINGGFGFVVALNEDWDTVNAQRYIPESGEDTPLTIGVPSGVKAGTDKGFIAPEAAFYTVNLNLVDKTVTITKAPVDYTQWYVNVLGDFNNWEDNGVAADAEGIAKHDNLPIGTSSFKVKVYNGVSDVWFSTGGALAQNTWVTIPGNNDANMTIEDAVVGDMFNVEYNCADNSIKVVKVVQDGIANVAVDANARAEYFNLQGVRVAQPATGLYIVRQGGKVSKVYVK